MSIGVLGFSKPPPFMRKWQRYVLGNADVTLATIGIGESRNGLGELGRFYLFSFNVQKVPFGCRRALPGVAYP